jgi:hypothetical protein
VVLVQVVGLMLILAFVLIFRNNLGVATSALFESMAPEDVRVAPSKEGDTNGGAEGDAPAADVKGSKEPGAEGAPAQEPSNTSDK